MASFGGDDKQEEIEKSLRKGRFHKALFSKFAKAINTYDLIQPGDKIAVCISGGKDSMLMAKLFQELKRHNKFPFELVFLVMDPGYSEVNRKLIENNARIMGVPITVFDPRFLKQYMISKSPHAICVQECAAAICIIRQKNLGAIRLHWGIIMTMSLRPF